MIGINASPPAFAIVQQAKLAANQLGAVYGVYSDTYIEFGHISTVILKPRKYIFYLIAEGPLHVRPPLADYIIAPNRYICRLAEQYWGRCDGIIPHTITTPCRFTYPKSGIRYIFGDAGGVPRYRKFCWEYERRKIPEVSIVVTNFMYPRDKLDELMASTHTYANLTCNEGVGLMPIEMLTYGARVISNWYPALEDYLSDGLIIEVVGEKRPPDEIKPFGTLDIEIYRPNLEKFREILKKEVGYEELFRRFVHNCDVINERYRNTYKRFLEFLK